MALLRSSSLIVLQQVTELHHHLFGCLIMIMAPPQPLRPLLLEDVINLPVFLFGFISGTHVFSPTSSRLRKPDGCFLRSSRFFFCFSSHFYPCNRLINANLCPVLHQRVRTSYIPLNANAKATPASGSLPYRSFKLALC